MIQSGKNGVDCDRIGLVGCSWYLVDDGDGVIDVVGCFGLVFVDPTGTEPS